MSLGAHKSVQYAVVLDDVKKSFDGGREFILKGIDLKVPKGSLTSPKFFTYVGLQCRLM